MLIVLLILGKLVSSLLKVTSYKLWTKMIQTGGKPSWRVARARQALYPDSSYKNNAWQESRTLSRRTRLRDVGQRTVVGGGRKRRTRSWTTPPTKMLVCLLGVLEIYDIIAPKSEFLRSFLIVIIRISTQFLPSSSLRFWLSRAGFVWRSR